MERRDLRIESVMVKVSATTHTSEMKSAVVPSAVDRHGIRYMSAEAFVSGTPVMPPIYETATSSPVAQPEKPNVSKG